MSAETMLRRDVVEAWATSGIETTKALKRLKAHGAVADREREAAERFLTELSRRGWKVVAA